jgi:hypothetical protein
MLRAWRRTEYSAAGAMARIGRRSPAMDKVLATMRVREAVLISADNPFGRRHPDGTNARRREALKLATRRLRAAEGEGRLGRWKEHHLLLGVSKRVGLMLARRFRQGGIVSLRRGARAELVTR